MKPFGSHEEIEEVIKEEYIKIFKEEPKKISIARLTLWWQFIIFPQKIMFQMDNSILRSKNTFSLLIRRNILQWIASHKEKLDTSVS